MDDYYKDAANQLIQIKHKMRELEENEKVLKESLKPYLKENGSLGTSDGRVYYRETKGAKIFSRSEVLKYIRRHVGTKIADQVDENCTIQGGSHKLVYVELFKHGTNSDAVPKPQAHKDINEDAWYDGEGFDKYGFDRDGIHKETKQHTDKYGFDKAGYYLKVCADPVREYIENSEAYSSYLEDTTVELFGEDFDEMVVGDYFCEHADELYNAYLEHFFEWDEDNEKEFDDYFKSLHDLNGFDRDGIHQDTGTEFDTFGYNRDGYDKNGFDRYGWDHNGFDEEGHDKFGFKINKIHKETNTEYDCDGYDVTGFNLDGFNRDGYDITGRDIDGYDINGHDQEGYNRYGYDAQGLDRNGYNCRGRDKDGYDKNGYDENGYSRDGYDTNGFDCNKLNRYTKTAFDSLGFDYDGFDKSGRHREGFCLLELQDKVCHSMFGVGTVLKLDGDGVEQNVDVMFNSGERKTLKVRLAGLEKYDAQL